MSVENIYVRTLRTGVRLGVDQRDGSYFVVSQESGRQRRRNKWSTHTGPFKERHEAVEWIRSVREDR